MTEANPFSQMVVIGSSAGGVEALSTLVHTLPSRLRAPVVVAQHLDPSRESRLGEILSRSSTLPVRTLSEYERLEPGVVYVVPANRDVEITDHDIRLVRGTHRSRPSIDRLFASAADISAENLIAVVLTGTGSDGAAGALEVQHAGGTVIIQDPSTATFPARPRSLAPSAVDFVMPLEEIGGLIQGLLSGKPAAERTDEDEALTRILRLLRDRHGIDFESYKPATIMRRVQRRLAATGTSDHAQYLRYLQRHPDEQHALVATFLIKVTKFFRDPDLFNVLRDRVTPDVVEAARQRDHTIRLWSAGCATGEEAYSLAILLAEVLGDDLEQFHVRIFATDLDPDAITFARQGVYAPSSLSALDPAIVERHFDLIDGSYQITKRIRALTVFGQHNLGERAPFPRVDLVLCRNVLIYFTTDLQRRILQLFAFSIRDGGYLILGKSETTTPFGDPFSQDDGRLKIYRRRGDRAVIPTTPIRDMTMPEAPRMASARPSLYGRALTPPSAAQREQSYGLRAEGVLFDLPVGIVVVDRRYDIQYINEAARALFGIHTSAIGDDLIHLVRTVTPAELRALIDLAWNHGERSAGLLAAGDGASETNRYLDVVCVPAPVGNESAPLVTVCASDVTQRVDERLRREEELKRLQQTYDHAEQQRSQLASTNRELLSTNQQLTREIAELRSQNEQFLVGNEELQAATEEVETLNEELQATNEELETLNEELQATVEELNTTNDDLQARNGDIQDLALRLDSARASRQTALNSLGEAIVVVDRDGSTVLTNGRFDEMFSAQLETLDVVDAEGSALPQGERPHERGARSESFRATFGVRSTDHNLRVFEIEGEPIRTDGADNGGILVIRAAEHGNASV
jgi:two-component system CheB/CheR fusion protein